MMYKPTVNTYFSGAGGMDLGLSLAGLDIRQSLEIEATFSETLRRNFSHQVIAKDIRDMEVLKQNTADVIAGTYPCQKYSTIADIHGTRTGDDLFLHFFRHVAIMEPEMYIVENVPGMKKFPVVMEAMSQLPRYFVNIFCPLNANIWLPQSRKRLILIGTKRPFFITPPSGTRRIRLKDIIEKDPEVNIPECVYSRMKGKYRDLPIISDPDKDDIAPTCVAHYAKDRGTRLLADKNFPMGVRPYTVREYARLQGFPDSFQFAGTENQQLVQIGNAVPVHMAEWIGQNAMQYFN